MEQSDDFVIWLSEHSAHLARLCERYPELVKNFQEQGAGNSVQTIMDDIAAFNTDNTQQWMQEARINKGKLSLLVALADITKQWGLFQVTAALSQFAEATLAKTVDILLLAAEKRGEIAPRDAENPSKDSGIIVLGMGKLGAGELNYSSDIDIIIFFEPDKLGYQGRASEQQFMNKLAQDIVTIMQERTKDGYVFRTDIRLRPDPASTPPAITINAAYYYYESVGQNWERAAMIKAKPVAGDIAAGVRFLHSLTPYIWRRNLDFAAINDIHSIKRQMDSRHSKAITLANHNIKLGIGGIREIEFYAQIHQLIWGGRKPVLRHRATCDTLNELVAEGLIEPEKRDTLIASYHYLRTLEHRLQMVADEQTHTIPKELSAIESLAAFMHHASVEEFQTILFTHLNAVHKIYFNSFSSAEQLGDGGSLVFTGVSHDPDTLETLSAMGYQHPETVSEMVMGWHHGSKRCTRTKRARELITELMPTLLRRLAETANPDAAFLKFNDFLTYLPAGVQLFSLFSANPKLLKLIADIMGSAPLLADTLSKSPELIESVLFSDFYQALPNKHQLITQAKERIAYAEDMEEALDHLTRFRNEKQFQAGVQLLRHMIDAKSSGQFMSLLTEVVIQLVVEITHQEFSKNYGVILHSGFSVIALGKLGSSEMTFNSDVDLVFVYEVADFETVSTGEKSFTASVYFNRFAQRLVNALSSLNRAGKLYEVDTRLRPSGKQGLLAVSTQALEHYFSELAWTFEFMAFTKARAVAGDAALVASLNQFVQKLMTSPRDAAKLKTDVADMREKMAEKYPAHTMWDLKHARGGLVDIDFLAQYWLLRHAPHHPDNPPHASADEIFSWLKKHNLENAAMLASLEDSYHFMSQIFNVLRLTVGDAFDKKTALPALKSILCKSVGIETFAQLEKRLGQLETTVHAIYIKALTE